VGRPFPKKGAKKRHGDFLVYGAGTWRDGSWPAPVRRALEAICTQ
jgi:hypothetical protein